MGTASERHQYVCIGSSKAPYGVPPGTGSFAAVAFPAARRRFRSFTSPAVDGLVPLTQDSRRPDQSHAVNACRLPHAALSPDHRRGHASIRSKGLNADWATVGTTDPAYRVRFHKSLKVRRQINRRIQICRFRRLSILFETTDAWAKSFRAAANRFADCPIRLASGIPVVRGGDSR